MTDWNPQANKILLEALRIDNAIERSAYVDEACGDDESLRRAVTALLDAHDDAGQFLHQEERSDDSLFAPGTMLAGRFVIRRELGQGGMGIVYLADQTQPVRRQVAIKLVKQGIDAQGVAARFDQERNALALMDHPHIAKIYEAGVIDLLTGHELGSGHSLERAARAAPFFAMEYLAGIPINDYCDRQRLGLRERLQLFIPVCQAVQHAHQKGIVHRDLKPTNILVELIDGQAIAKVIDFGVAKATGDKLTERTVQTSIGSIVGTLEYMSPEQAGFSEDIDTRTDVYALGAVLYELLVGSVPHDRQEFQTSGLEEMLRIIKEDDAIAPSARLSGSGTLANIAADRDTLPGKLVRSVRGDLDWILLKALDKNRERRYASVTGFAHDIQRFLDEEPVQARPPSAVYRIQKAYRRHRGAFFAAGIALVLLVLGTIGTSVGFIRAARSAVAAKAEARRAAAAEAETRVALVEAQQQRDVAETERGISTAVTDFLLDDLLQQAKLTSQAYRLLELQSEGDDSHELKRDPTILELVDRAALRLAPDEIEKRFPDQPKVQATLLKTLGDVYNSIGHAEKALDLLERAREISERELGDLDPLSIDCLGVLTNAYYGVLRYDDALVVARDRLERSRSAFGELDRRTLYAVAGIVTALSLQEEPAAAIATAEEALRQIDQAPPTDAFDRDDVRAAIEFQLACAYFLGHRPKQASKLCERAFAYRQQRLGELHPKTLFCAGWLGSIYIKIAKHEEARELFEELVPNLEKLFGPQHFQTMSARENLAATYRRLGMLDRAIPLYEQCLQDRINRYGHSDVRPLRIRANLGLAFLNNGQVEPSIEHLALVVDRAWEHRELQFAVTSLVQAYTEDGQIERAEQLARKQLRHVREHMADNQYRLRASLFNLALTLVQADKLSDAEPILRELDAMNDQHAPGNWNTYNAKALLGAVLLDQKEFEEAEALLVAGYDGMKSRYKGIPLVVRFHVRDAVEWLIQLHEARGDEESAEEWRQRRANLDPPNLAAMRRLSWD